jgi:NAD(P)-dependent dehydrogenase (short-subunit alcohol dehydrogenase family)
MTEIAGRVAVVTGGGSGIGHGLALELAAQGAAVGVTDIIYDNAVAVAKEITDKGGRAHPVQCDVIERDAVMAMRDEVTKALGPVSLLFANAGATSFEKVTDMTEKDVDWIIHVNMMGVTNCILAFYPDMVKARDGHIFATASTAGLMPHWIAYHAPYSGAKMGIIGLMLNLQIEAAEYGVGATVLCPGGVVSNMKAKNMSYRPARFGGPTDEEVHISSSFIEHDKVVFRPADEVARLCLKAVRENKPMVISDGRMREIFVRTYQNLVHDAFDFVDEFDAAETAATAG